MIAGDGQLYFDAVLWPNPPMSLQIRCCIVAAAATVNAIFATLFVLRGAWPVTPFMGTDVLLLAWALYSSSKAAKRREEVRLTGSALRVDYYPAWGEPTHIELNPYWVQVHLDEPLQSSSAITLTTSQGRLLRIGSFLSPRERLSFARALRFALERARRGA